MAGERHLHQICQEGQSSWSWPWSGCAKERRRHETQAQDDEEEGTQIQAAEEVRHQYQPLAPHGSQGSHDLWSIDPFA